MTKKSVFTQESFKDALVSLDVKATKRSNPLKVVLNFKRGGNWICQLLVLVHFGTCLILLIQTQVTGDIASALNATSGDVPGTGYAAKFTTTVTLDEAEEIALYLAAAGDATIYVDGMEVASVRCETLEGAAQGPCPNSGGSMCLCNAGSRYKADAEILTIDAGVHDITVEYLGCWQRRPAAVRSGNPLCLGQCRGKCHEL